MKKLTSFAVFVCFFRIIAAQEITLPPIFTYIEDSLVEQKEVLTAEDISRANVTDLPSLLSSAGIQILSYGAYGLEQKPSMRGFTDETVRVIIDGICVNNPQYGTFDFTSLNLEDIERIEIVRGGFTESVSDEGAVGGAIYISTRKQEKGQNFSSDTSFSSFFNIEKPVDTITQGLGYKGQISEQSYLNLNLKGTTAENKYLYESASGRIRQRENSSVLDGNLSADFLHYFKSGSSMNISDLFYAGKKCTPGSASGVEYGVQQDYSNNATVHFVHPSFMDLCRFENSFALLDSIRYYDTQNAHSSHQLNTGKYSGSANFFKTGILRQSAGITAELSHLNSTDDGIHTQGEFAIKSTSRLEIPLGTTENASKTKNMLDISLPVSFKVCGENLAFVPKFGIGFEFSKINVFADVYRMVQFPNMDDLYWDDGIYKGNPELKPETGWGGEITMNVHDVFLPFSLCAFTNYYENKIQWTSLSMNDVSTSGIQNNLTQTSEPNSHSSSGGKSGMAPQNISSAFYFGIDFSAKKEFADGLICFKMNAEYLYTMLLDKSKITYGKKIMWTPDFVASSSLFVNIPKAEKFPGASLGLEINYVGKRYISNLNISFMKPYVLVNIVGESKKIKVWSCNLVPYFRLNNLLNTRYESVEDYPMPGINLTIGLKLSN